MSPRAKLPATTRFQKLVDDISNLYMNARTAQVDLALGTGLRLVEEEQNGEMRAAYGSRLIPKVAKELTKKHGPGFSETVLRRMRKFYLFHQKQSTSTELNWSDYVELLPIKDAQMRKKLAQRVIREGWQARQIRAEVKRFRQGRHEFRGKRALPAPSATPPAKPLPPLKHPTNLKLGTFALSTLHVKLKVNQVLIDCGFFVNWPVDKDQVKHLNIVEEMSYTYVAAIDRVIDGDTLHVLVEAGFGIIMHDRLRLRGIDCPEVGTPEGDAAKKFVQELLPPGSIIVLKSHKDRTDVHGRFVVDVLYLKGVADTALIIKEGIYLNQELVDKGFAKRVDY